MTTKKLTIDRLAFAVLFATLFLITFFFIPHSAVTLDASKTMLLVLGVFASFSLYLIGVVKKGEFEFPSHRALWAVLLIPAAFFASSLLSGSAQMSLLGYNLEIGTAAFITLGFVLMFLTAVFFRSRKRITLAYLGFAAGYTLVLLYALVKFFFGADALSFGVLSGIIVSPVGTWTDLGVLAAGASILGLMALEELPLSRLWRWVAAVVALISVIVLAAVNVQSIWIALLVFSLVYLLYTFSLGSGVPHRDADLIEGDHRISYGALGLLIVSLLFVFNPIVSTSGATLGTAVSSMFGISRVEVSPSMSATYEATRPVLKENPIFGSGPNTFDTVWTAHKPAAVNQSIFWNTSFSYGIGLLPTFLATTGLLGALLWILFIVFFVFLGLRAIFVRNEDGGARFFSTASFFFSLFLWAVMFFYIPSKTIFALAFFSTGLFFATAALQGIIARRVIVFRASSKLAFVAVLFLVAALVGNVAYVYSAVKQSAATVYFGKAQLAASQGDVEAARTEALRAAHLSGEDVYYGALAQIGSARVNAILNATTSSPDLRTAFQNALQETIAAAQAATQVRPQSYQNWVTLGTLYESLVPAPFSVQGAYEGAKAAYLEAATHNPESPEPYYLLARLEVANKQNNAARDYLRQALEKKRDYADAYYLQTQIDVSENRIDEAITSAAALAVLAPQNAGVFFQLGVLKYNAHDYQGALDALSQALSISPDYADARYFQGLTLYKLGEKEQSLAAFKELEKTNPDNETVQAIILNLEAGRDPLYKLGGSAPASQSPNPPISASSTKAR